MQDIYLNIDQLAFGYSLTIFVTFQFLDELTTFTQFGHIAVTSLLVHGELSHNSSILLIPVNICLHILSM